MVAVDVDEDDVAPGTATSLGVGPLEEVSRR